MESEKLQQQDYIKCTIIQGAPTHNLFPGILRKENYICRFKIKCHSKKYAEDDNEGGCFLLK